ncbi:probable galactinol--sucrose galactosyltransferase 1 [Salvia hispanica]|uniref:probable galactinol--sucrose galactosyltransferase 1 n=1 Tax=Salvia hispanica TaxID=49212 RepID=UPI00200950AA|nr:probable galactinol--sucrose galactosyltransferase 1 [Salvia hispanica]
MGECGELIGKEYGMDPTSEKTEADNCANFANRLTNIKENHKFQKDGIEGERIEDPAKGIQHIVSEIKDEHSVKFEDLKI